ncbi:MAG: hypothetical protein NTV61_11620 [Candidatus Bathyarchaeota archaeon]|nr:hypothetical protein [Candidatus Bathyarchaeota archaeon]
MRQILVFDLLAVLIVASLGLGYLYIDANTKISDLKTVSNNQNTRINELESMLSASREAWEIVNITKSYGSSYERAQISLVATYHSLYLEMYENGTLLSGKDHMPEYAYIYSPRANMTLRINANVDESTRNISIWVFKEKDSLSGYNRSRLVGFEAKPDAYNEFNVVLPVKGWYYVFSRDRVFYSDPNLDYKINVEMRLYDGVRFIPFVIRIWNVY